MNKTIVVIVGAIAGAKGITLYHEDGRETNLALDSWRTKQIMDKVTPYIARHEKVEIDLATFDVHAHLEQKTGGFIRFVREKVASVRQWFRPSAEDDASKNVEAFAETSVVDGHRYGVPAANPEADTIVAIIGGSKVPGIEALEKHIEHAINSGDTEGVENFMKRIASVIDKRGHSVQELLHFMQKGDLPIAKDGSIIAYKVLTNTSDHQIVDCHSRKVIQKVGSRVVMDEHLVDPSRRTQCSSGLHIARRGYLHGFSGDVIMMVKIAPEEVIAVPLGEPNKMRVAAYHIVGEIPKTVHDLLRSNQPMTKDDAASRLLADVIAGNHVGVLEEVRITGPKGDGLKITSLIENAPGIVHGVNGAAKALDDGAEKPSITVQALREAAKAAAPTVPAQVAEITTQHVQMINGDLHVDGKLIESETTKERGARLKRESRAALTKKPTPAPVKTTNAEQLSERHAKALKLHAGGMSLRKIEKELKICRKTVRRLIDKA
ncbi:hypothetical protein [Phyllobacterium myrsinacearum]|uniref:DNA-binding NarL/FixJ family response regulator n=1 Tax=Phyllobacterium myrsinacearum TaxID=28101 RepID=A0A839EYS6_9HYPH|nr:hypothetical protein [Phyllobacterium myrsinacearum]MBA8881630.1 DNA-binding NarL/FixJ family response regulator [Phyllobacterium myrsinacearum]